MKVRNYPIAKIKGFKTRYPIRVTWERHRYSYQFRLERYQKCVVDAVCSFRDFKHSRKHHKGIMWNAYGWFFVA